MYEKKQVNLLMRFQTCASKSKSKTVTSTCTNFQVSNIFFENDGSFFFACLKTVIEFSIQAFKHLKPISFFSPLKVKCPNSVVPAFSWERECGKVARAYSEFTLKLCDVKSVWLRDVFHPKVPFLLPYNLLSS